MAPGDEVHFEGPPHDIQVLLKDLLPPFVQFQEDVVVRDGGQDPRFFQPHFLDPLQVFPVGADPPGDLREPVPSLLTPLHGLPVPIAVKEEFGLPDDPVGAAQPVEEIKKVDDLLDRKRRSGLLSVPKRGIRDEPVGGRGDRENFMVKIDPANFVVRENRALQVGFRHLLQGVAPKSGVFMIQNPALGIPLGHSSFPQTKKFFRSLKGDNPVKSQPNDGFVKSFRCKARKN